MSKNEESALSKAFRENLQVFLESHVDTLPPKERREAFELIASCLFAAGAGTMVLLEEPIGSAFLLAQTNINGNYADEERRRTGN